MSAFRGLFRAAKYGFAVAAVFACYQLLTDSQSPISRKPLVMLVFAIFCPPSILSAAFDPEIRTKNFYPLWTVIAMMNGGLYATIRLLISRRLHRSE